MDNLLSERIFYAGCDLSHELHADSCLSGRNSMTTPPPGPKHSCVSQFLIVNIHLYFTLSVGGGGGGGWGGFIQAALPSVRATTQLIIDKPNGQHAPQSQ